MKLIKSSLICLMSLTVALVSFSQFPLSQAKADGLPSVPFSVKISIPKNQEKGIGSYFSLYTMPNQIQTVDISVQNISKEPITLSIQPVNALTIKNGGIEYTSESKNQASEITDPAYQMANNIKVQKKIFLNPHEAIQVPVIIQTPQINKGIYLGGLLLSKSDDGVNKKQNKNGFSILNKTVIGIAIQLIMPNHDVPNVVIKNSDVSFLPSGVELSTIIENTSATIVRGLNGKFTIYDKDKNPLFFGHFENFKMAPKTNVNYSTFWNAKKIKNGDYYLSMELSLNGKKIVKENQFTISKSELAKYEKENKIMKPTVEISVIPIWIWILIGFMSVTICFFIVFFIRKSNRNKSI